MALRDMMTTTASTERAAAMSGGKKGTPVTNLTNLLIFGPNPLAMQGQQDVRKALGMDGTAVVIREAFTESHTHTDGGVSVTQMPDIIEGDRLIVGSDIYSVKLGQEWGATSSFGETLHMYLVLDKRF